MDVDWIHRADYMAARHGVSVEEANEALADPGAVVIDPDTESFRAERSRYRLLAGCGRCAGR